MLLALASPVCSEHKQLLPGQIARLKTIVIDGSAMSSRPTTAPFR